MQSEYRQSQDWKLQDFEALEESVCLATSPLHHNSRLGFSAVTSVRVFLIAPEKWNFTSIGFHCRLTEVESWKLNQNCFRILVPFQGGKQEMSMETYYNNYFGEHEKTLSPLLSSPPHPLFQIELLINSTVIKCDSEENKYVSQCWRRLGHHL